SNGPAGRQLRSINHINSDYAIDLTGWHGGVLRAWPLHDDRPGAPQQSVFDLNLGQYAMGGMEGERDGIVREESKDFLKHLVSTPSPSGFEERIQAVCRDYAERFVDTVYKDVHGNQYFVRNPDAPLRVMLAGHVDEIGLMVNYIDDQGFISFTPIGGVDASVLDGQRVVIHGTKGPVHGVIGRKAIHLMDEEERGKALKMHELWIDIAAKDREDAESVVMVSDPITID